MFRKGLKTAFFFFGQNILGNYVKLNDRQDFDINLMFWVHEGHRKFDEKDDFFALIPEANDNERFLDPEMIRTPPHQDRPGTLEFFQVFEITTPE